MTLSGPHISRQIRQSRRSTQLALTEARAAAKATGGELRSLAVETKHAIASLPPSALPAVERDSLLGAIDAMNGEIRQILLRRDQHVLGLDRELAVSDRERAASEDELERITAELDQQWSNQLDASTAVAQRLTEDERFKICTHRVAEAEAALQRAEASLAEIEYDAMQKLPAYEKSRLFMYLHDRRFGTPRYSANQWNQRIDTWIARLIDYPRARAGYEFLKNSPERIRAWMAADRDAIAPLMQQLERRCDEYAAQLGLPQITAEVRSTVATRDRVLAELEQIRRKKDISRQELAEVEGVRGPFYRQAFERFESLLEGAESQLGPLAEPLHSIRAQLRTLELRATARQERILSLNRHLSELGYFHQRFCAAGLDSSQITFDRSLELASDLERVFEEGISIDLVWQRMRGSQHDALPPRPAPVTVAEQVQSHVLATAMAQAAQTEMADYARRAATRWSGAHRGRTKKVA